MSQKTTNTQTPAPRFNKSFYKTKFIFSSGKKFRNIHTGKYSATAHVLYCYISGSELKMYGIKKAIELTAEKHNIPAGYYAHIYGLKD